ncbi:nuclear transport factor 2 family protein [Leptolyngbya cf. ectocarpi LEGE 11479]|uniref:Nuclear transport factor 2 family protein n=1 Tax=Leptolyngbya cf. ectocarpi LEGE 11479 TaxID=1828722 RepID=A0A929F5K1_LEPEC|nr:nuclear transport factor 2 family protein [Leptolyngbya ectocarpi]MBE9067640.1 nuclear transport factor 2 family protein [Leptolyngbya cf. ectocarpi LEGE 11479]
MKNKIIELEERLRLAMLNSDISELDKLISPDLLFTNHCGVLVSKEDDLNAHSSKAFVFKSLDLSESKILIHENSAVVSVKAEIQGYYNGQSANGSFRFTRFWLNTSGKWQLVAGHSSVIA